MISPRANSTLTDLIHAHRGRAAVVMGGAPCLVRDMERIASWPMAKNAVYLSANEHAFKLAAPPRVDYIVACDNAMKDTLRSRHVQIISPRPWADYRVLHQKVSNSGSLGAVAAWVMGCAPIVIVGVEMYQGGTYHYDAHAKSSGKTATLHQHLKRWERLPMMTPGSQLRAVSGPLLTLPGILPFDPHEAPAQIAGPQSIEVLVAGRRMEIVRDVPNWNGLRLARGSIMEMRESEAGQAILEGYARRYVEREMA